MTNILIADDNFYYARNLMSYINSVSKNARVCSITMDGKETIDILNKTENIDIVLLDLKMPIYTGIQIIKMLSLKQINKYKQSFIIISGENSLMKDEVLGNDVIYKILPKTLRMFEIINEINNLIKEKENNKLLDKLELEIMNELLYLGYDISHKGTKYLADVINMVYMRGEELMGNLNKYVYPIIAKRYCQSITNIKCNILRATENMYYNCDEQKLMDYFLFQQIFKPNVKTVISTILLKLKKNYIYNFLYYTY